MYGIQTSYTRTDGTPDTWQYIDGLAQERRKFIVISCYVFLALSPRYVIHIHVSFAVGACPKIICTACRSNCMYHMASPYNEFPCNFIFADVSNNRDHAVSCVLKLDNPSTSIVYV